MKQRKTRSSHSPGEGGGDCTYDENSVSVDKVERKYKKARKKRKL